MRRSVSFFCLVTLCGCTGGARASRAPAGTPANERVTSVPSFVGLDLETAAERAYAAGLELMALRVPGTPAGSVLEQSPAAGRLVPEGAPIRVRIASGSVAGAVPVAPPALPDDVAAGPGVPPAPPPELPPSVVPDVAPPAVPPAAGAPDEPLSVPSVLDRTEPVARRILSDAGFRVRIEATESGVTGRVMDQLPSPGDRVARGSEILLKVPGFVPSADAALGSPDAAPEGTTPSTPPAAVPEAPAPVAVAPPPPNPPAPPAPTLAPPPDAPVPVPTVPPDVVAPAPTVPTTPPAVAVEPPGDTVPVPIFAGPKSIVGADPTGTPPAPESAQTPPEPVAPPAPAAPTPPPVPGTGSPADGPAAPPSSPTESAGEPAGPSLPGLEIPKPKSPPSESRIPIAPSVSVDLSWEPVAGATGYLIELEELVDAAWTPLQRRIVKAPRALAQIEPSNPTAADMRWRVRSVVGRRGGRPAPWVVFHLR